jgi:mycofactocin precursor
MPDSDVIVTENTEATADDVAVVEAELVESDLLVEDVSIDGMCGVY